MASMGKQVRIVSEGDGARTRIYDREGNDITTTLSVKCVKIDIAPGRPNAVWLLLKDVVIDIQTAPDHPAHLEVEQP